jgi:hypothetical protein
MRKNELIHLHSLLREVRTEYAADADDDAFDEYESLGVAPTHVHESKDNHREAVLTLSAQLADELSKRGKYSDDGSPETATANG